MPFEFSIDSKYSSKGVLVTINGASMNLLPDEVSYLLLGVDGQATFSASEPPPEVGFMLRARLHILSNETWVKFIDHLTSVAGEGGWQPTSM